MICAACGSVTPWLDASASTAAIHSTPSLAPSPTTVRAVGWKKLPEPVGARF